MDKGIRHIVSLITSTTMKKQYFTPSLQVHGAVEALTAFEGDTTQADVLVNSRGAIIGTGSGSIDACTQVGGTCLFNRD